MPRQNVTTVARQGGDLRVQVRGEVFLVSSSRLSLLSPKFAAFAENQSTLLLDEDPQTMWYLLQTAHDIFIPIRLLSLDKVLKLADVITRYGIPEGSRVYALVKFYYITKTLQPENIDVQELPRVVEFARFLGPPMAIKLMVDLLQSWQGDDPCFDLSAPPYDQLLGMCNIYVQE